MKRIIPLLFVILAILPCFSQSQGFLRDNDRIIWTGDVDMYKFFFSAMPKDYLVNPDIENPQNNGIVFTKCRYEGLTENPENIWYVESHMRKVNYSPTPVCMVEVSYLLDIDEEENKIQSLSQSTHSSREGYKSKNDTVVFFVYPTPEEPRYWEGKFEGREYTGKSELLTLEFNLDNVLLCTPAVKMSRSFGDGKESWEYWIPGFGKVAYFEQYPGREPVMTRVAHNIGSDSFKSYTDGVRFKNFKELPFKN